MIIGFGSDHAGYQLKNILKKMTSELNAHSVIDVGCYTEESVDYPDFVHPLMELILEKKIDKVVLVCGSGNGVAITANKYSDVRCALCWKPEIASLARLHNNANAIAIPARFVTEEEAKEILNVFLSTNFEGGRHESRVNKINKLSCC